MADEREEFEGLSGRMDDRGDEPGEDEEQFDTGKTKGMTADQQGDEQAAG